MSDAYIHRFKWEGRDDVRKELTWFDPKDKKTPLKETVEVIELERKQGGSR